MFENIILILLLFVLGISFAAITLTHWDWMPVILLLILWYIPRQTATGGLLENYLILRWITVFIIPLIIFVQFTRVTLKSRSLKLSNIALPLGIFIVLSVCSGILNNVTPYELFGSLILYIRYPLLFIVFINMDIPQNVVKIFFRLFLFLVAIQIPECIYRYVALGITWDHISWTMGPWGTFDLGVYMTYAVVLIVALNLIKGVKWSHFALLALFFVVALLGEIKAFVFFAPVASVFTIYAVLRQKRLPNQKPLKHVLTVLLPVFFLILIYFASTLWTKVYYGSGDTVVSVLQDIPAILKHPLSFFEIGGMADSTRRLSGVAVVWNYLKRDGYTLMFGLGPGSTLAGNFPGAIPGRTSDISIPYLSQIGAMLADVGIVGLSLFFWILLRLLRMIVKANRLIEDLDIRILSAGLMGMWVYYALLGPFYYLVWRQDAPNYIFYFFMAVVYKGLHNKHPEVKE